MAAMASLSGKVALRAASKNLVSNVVNVNNTLFSTPNCYLLSGAEFIAFCSTVF